MRIWFRVGMTADVTKKEFDELMNGNEDLMREVIERGWVDGETYIASKITDDGLYNVSEEGVEYCL